MSLFLQNRRLLTWSLAFVIITYSIFLGVDLVYGINCWSTGIDFCAYWSSGKAALENGVGGIYDLEILRNYQKAVYPRMFDPTAPYEYLPFPYLPVFSLPFLAFAKLPIQQSYLLWSALNFAALLTYFLFFYRSVSGNRPYPWMIILLLLLSAPFFNNIKFGQLNVWLGISAGEFVRNSIKGRRFLAGLWLIGLLLKFQTLILVVPFLLFTKNFKSLFSFTVGTFVLLGGSYWLVGTKGVLDFWEILSGSAVGDSAANVLRMANWRMLGGVLDYLFDTNVVNFVMLLGAGFVIWLLVINFRNFDMKYPEENLLGFFLIFLATTLITVHSHFEMNLLFYPLFLIAVDRGWITAKVFFLWFWVGFSTFVLLVIFDAVISYFDLFGPSYRFILLSVAPVGFVINLKIFFESLKIMQKMKLEARQNI